MKVRTDVKAGHDIAVAIGALAVNLSKIYQANSSAIVGNHNVVAQANVAAVHQTATATNSGKVTAVA